MLCYNLATKQKKIFRVDDGCHALSLEAKVPVDVLFLRQSDSLVFEEEVTFMAWSMIEKWNGDGDQWIDKGAHSAGSTGCGIMVHGAANFYFMLGDGGARQDLTFPAAGKVPMGKEWHHIAATYDGEEMIAYGNGEPFGNNKASFKLSCTTNVPLYVGGGVDRPQYVFDGALDEVAVFNRALSQNEVKNAMDGLKLSVGVAGHLTATWGRIKAEYK